MIIRESFFINSPEALKEKAKIASKIKKKVLGERSQVAGFVEEITSAGEDWYSSQLVSEIDNFLGQLPEFTCEYQATSREEGDFNSAKLDFYYIIGSIKEAHESGQNMKDFKSIILKAFDDLQKVVKKL